MLSPITYGSNILGVAPEVKNIFAEKPLTEVKPRCI